MQPGQRVTIIGGLGDSHELYGQIAVIVIITDDPAGVVVRMDDGRNLWFESHQVEVVDDSANE